MFIVLQLCKEKILQHPLLYISEYLTKNRDTYIELLYNTSAKGEIEQWLLFFLKGLENQAKKSLELLKNIDSYKKELHDKVRTISQNQKIHLIVDFIFKQPFFTVSDIKELLNTSQPTAWNWIKKLIKIEIVEEFKTEGNTKIYLAKKIIILLESN